MVIDFQTGWNVFKNYAEGRGYTRKIVGDYAFRRSRKMKGEKQHRYIRLVSLSDGVKVHEDKVGKFIIKIEVH